MQSDTGEWSVLLMLDLIYSFWLLTITSCSIGWNTWLVYQDLLWNGISSYLSEWSFSVAAAKFIPYQWCATRVCFGAFLVSFISAFISAPFFILNSYKDMSYHCYADDIQFPVNHMMFLRYRSCWGGRALVCSYFYHLKNIAKLSPFVSCSEMEMIIDFFYLITSRWL